MDYNLTGEKTTMNFGPTHDRLMSLVFSAMLTSAFLATAPEGMIAAGAGPNIQAVFTQMQASGFPGTAALSSPGTVTTPASVAVDVPAKPAAPLSMEQLQKIRRNLEERNKRIPLDPTSSYLLGLTRKGEVLTLLTRTLKDSKNINHTFTLLDGNTGYVVSQRTENGMAAYRLDTDLNILAAFYSPSDGSGDRVLPRPEAEKILHEELLTWAKIADTFLGANPQVAAAVRP